MFLLDGNSKPAEIPTFDRSGDLASFLGRMANEKNGIVVLDCTGIEPRLISIKPPGAGRRQVEVPAKLLDQLIELTIDRIIKDRVENTD